MIKRRAAIFAALALALAATSAAQVWRGQGHVAGKVTDEAGKPIEGVTVKLFLPSGNGGVEVKTSKGGEWAAGGIGSGAWQIDYIKDGYEPRRITVDVEQLNRLPMIPITLKKAAADPNVLINAELKRAAGLVGEKKFAEAQAIYADLLSKYPQAYQLELTIARAYHAEGVYDKEIEHLKRYLQADPNNIEVKLLTGAEMIAKGNPDEGKALLATIDETKVTEPAVFLNVGINLLNQNKAKDALTFFEKTISRFPEYPDAYYYRGITNLQISSALAPDDKAAADKLLQAGKADLTKFVEMAPNAPEAAMAKKMLEQLK